MQEGDEEERFFVGSIDDNLLPSPSPTGLNTVMKRTPLMERSMHDRFVWVELYAKAQKMKNLSNKGKE